MDSRGLPPEMSNFDCLPGKAGGSPFVLGEKCSFAHLLLFKVRKSQARYSQYCRKIWEYGRV
jgi:hypothetical protein